MSRLAATGRRAGLVALTGSLLLHACASWAAIVLPSAGAGDAGTAASSSAAPAAPAAPGSSIRVPAPRSDASLQALRRQAQEGEVSAQFELGMYYYHNAGLPQAGAQARQWLGQAAAQGDARAMAALGYMLGTGTGGVRDVPAGRQWLQRAADARLAKATYLMSLVERRVTGPRAMQQSRLLLEQAARDGEAMALNDLAVERELEGRMNEAKELYAQAQAGGSQTAAQNLARIASYQRASTSEQLGRLRARADEGNANALLELAYRYHLGRGVQRNFATAIQYYRRAADAGSPKAREFLALIFSRSNEKQPVIDEAWMQELAARINAVALQVEEKHPSAPPDRPQRVADPLAQLSQQPFAWPEPPAADGDAATDTNTPPLSQEQVVPNEERPAPGHAQGMQPSNLSHNAPLTE
ncbi:tetratricopeptide repeat protein [Comamonas sp.]|uniref:tetratricopeptide repeat protein n=1 Tax=Comamonas sp. TaxID=34028 RepID=UPI0028977661|nr:tetratricopeptide repeat protein [Comamonas sp.]